MPLAQALRSVGRWTKLARIYTQQDLVNEGLNMCICDANWKYFDGTTSIGDKSRLDDDQRLLTLLTVSPTPYLYPSVPGGQLRFPL